MKDNIDLEVQNIEVNCKEILSAEKMNSENLSEIVDKYQDIEIVFSPQKPRRSPIKITQTRTQMLNNLIDASKKRRSKNLTLEMVKEMTQYTELVSNKPSGNIIN